MGYSILIVDDSATMRARTKHAIRFCGFVDATVYDADDGTEAWDILGRKHIDLVVADLTTSTGEALDAIERLLSEPETRGVPVILLWSRQNLAAVRRLRHAGARAELAMPFSREALYQVISEVLEPTHV